MAIHQASIPFPSWSGAAVDVSAIIQAQTKHCGSATSSSPIYRPYETSIPASPPFSPPRPFFVRLSGQLPGTCYPSGKLKYSTRASVSLPRTRARASVCSRWIGQGLERLESGRGAVCRPDEKLSQLGRSARNLRCLDTCRMDRGVAPGTQRRIC
jgi:hypothetical protein